MPNPVPIAYRGLAHEVVEALRGRILSGAIRPGVRIVESEVASELGVSRGPVRDALRLLEAEGLVETTPRRGTRVASMRREDALEIFAIRAALEPLAVRFLVERNDPTAFDALEWAIEKLERAAGENDWPQAVALDLDFHQAIFELSGRPRLLKIWSGLRVPMLQLFQHLSHFYGSIEEVPSRHRELLQTLRSGNLELALEQSAEHVTAWRERLLEAMADDPRW